MTSRLYIKTFGCQMNEYDSTRIANLLLASHNLELTTTPEEADVLLLNTCSIREKAQEKVFSQLGLWRIWKQKRPNLIIGVGGCVASQEGQDILDRAPFVDLVFGPQTLHRLPQMLVDVQQHRNAVIDTSFPQIEKFDCLPIPKAEGPTAYVSIMEGCSNYCTYCIVPYTRGEEFSRPVVDVLSEITTLATQGVREITLLGQNVNSYAGIFPDTEDTTVDLAALIRYVAAIDGIERIRFTTSHPKDISESLYLAFVEEPKLAGHVHLPVQSGSDRILAKMHRGHTVSEYLALIERLRQSRPNISISTDLIVGFPGETAADFEDTMELVDTVGFDYAYSFIYSPRPGTPAIEYPDSIPIAEKQDRLLRLQALIKAKTQTANQRLVGSKQRILVERQARKTSQQLIDKMDKSIQELASSITGLETESMDKHWQQLAGRTEQNRVVNFIGPLDIIGRFVTVHITEALPNSLRGILCN